MVLQFRKDAAMGDKLPVKPKISLRLRRKLHWKPWETLVAEPGKARGKVWETLGAETPIPP